MDVEQVLAVLREQEVDPDEDFGWSVWSVKDVLEALHEVEEEFDYLISINDPDVSDYTFWALDIRFGGAHRIKAIEWDTSTGEEFVRNLCEAAWAAHLALKEEQ